MQKRNFISKEGSCRQKNDKAVLGRHLAVIFVNKSRNFLKKRTEAKIKSTRDTKLWKGKAADSGERVERLGTTAS